MVNARLTPTRTPLATSSPNRFKAAGGGVSAVRNKATGPIPSATTPVKREVRNTRDVPLSQSLGNITRHSPTTPTAPRTFPSTLARGSLGTLRQDSHFTALPTTNTSIDSAVMSRLLHQESKFLIAPPAFDPPPQADTPDLSNASSTSPPRHDTSRDYRTIVFDLDETLCSNRGPGKAILRPGALDMLKSLRALSTAERPIEIVLWTASVESLARVVLARLDPTGTIFTHLIFRDRRWFKETGYTKDLRLLGRDMERVVIIENSPMSVTLNRQQSILVRDFMGHAPHDCDLKAVKDVLEGWITADSFTPIKTWLANHPKIDRGNQVIASPSLSTIAATATAQSPQSFRRTNVGLSTRSPMFGRRF